MPATDYSEDVLIEQPAIALFAELGWETANCFHETFGPHGTLGRETPAEVILVPPLRAALQRLNPDLPNQAIEQAIEDLTADRSARSPVHANEDVYRLLKQGVKVGYRDAQGEEQLETVRVIAWDEPQSNDFFLASQFWVTGELYKRRADLVGFVNGLPLVLIELKASHKRIEDAYERNLTDYKMAICQLFWPNAFIILSNGSQSRIGTLTAAWEHFNEWKKISDEAEPGVVSLETVIRGTCEPERLLDLVENFVLYRDVPGGRAKILAKNHQYLGVNNAVEALGRLEENRGRLGVFWHTQGAGKSLSMVFFAQKVLRTRQGNWTFVVVTDRKELDDQIYRTYAEVGAVTERELDVHAESGEHLQRLLREDHRYVFTLIQKFRSPPGVPYPTLSERSDVVVITDEAHRTQYDVLALNLRRALPHAAFLAFTGTPLIVGEENTREVFGDYVSVYDFRQSILDGATVPLYYENRIPQLQLTNEDLNEDLETLIEEAALDENQERRLEREFARQYHLITRDERLDTIAADIVDHYLGRYEADPEHVGKAMVVSIDKATAVRMHDKVRARWQERLVELREAVPALPAGPTRERAAAKVAFMTETDLAVVVSAAQNEAEVFARKGLDILPHRRRIVTEDLAAKFKDPDDPFRIVFVTAMWMTGFDVPSLATIYLDKPLRNHTLMQTIARANRVFTAKANGLIVDYVGIFRDLEKALAIYGPGPAGATGAGGQPVRDKAQLIEELRQGLDQAVAFLAKHGVLPEPILGATGFTRLKLLDDAVDALLVNDATKTAFLAHANAVGLRYRAILPDPAAGEFEPLATLLGILAAKIRALAPPTDISAMMAAVDELLDASIAPTGYLIPSGATERVDLARIDFEALRRRFAEGGRHTEVERLRTALGRTLDEMVQRNRNRIDYLERFQQLIADYNAGSLNVQLFFEALLAFAQELSAEEQRGIALGLSEEELTVFDLLTRPDPGLTEQETAAVRKAARELLERLKEEKLVLDWRKRQQTRADVLLTIQTVLDQGLPPAYSVTDYEGRCDAVYRHVYDAYFVAGESIYSTVA
jgi:type I restriction enzyme R subunit